MDRQNTSQLCDVWLIYMVAMIHSCSGYFEVILLIMVICYDTCLYHLSKNPCQTFHARKNCVMPFSCVKMKVLPQYYHGWKCHAWRYVQPNCPLTFLGRKNHARGEILYFHTWKYHFHAWKYGIYMHHDNMKFSCMEFSCHDSFMHESVCTRDEPQNKCLQSFQVQTGNVLKSLHGKQLLQWLFSMETADLDSYFFHYED